MKARLTSLVVFALVLVACVGCTPDSPTDDQLTASGASTTTPTATAIAVVPITAPMSGPLRIWQRPGAVIPTDARCIDVIDALLPLALAEEVGAEVAQCEMGMAEFLRLRLVADEAGVAYLDAVQLTVLKRNPAPSVSQECIDGRAALLPVDDPPEGSLVGTCSLEASLLHGAGETIRASMPLPAGPDLPADPRCHELLVLLGESSESPHDRYVQCRITP
jgi:hypothetical protein